MTHSHIVSSQPDVHQGRKCASTAYPPSLRMCQTIGVTRQVESTVPNSLRYVRGDQKRTAHQLMLTPPQRQQKGVS
eukprot:CAMPEP_0180704992 /NCGR_PEP_ID=MMETSP1038_2-20121128/7443_1 /TAXON_ID=632150 /ORGANISM="Azadinium spinosum, Strain 3D9" /LENGTH=75 /DNA_ID=CAMNT_0022736845 /DNA_START=126 /DNA_END=353 /DNA_ORIENTATION=-